MSIFKYTNISKDFELEEESLPKSKTTETDNTDNAIDEFLNSLSSIHKIASFAGYAESTEKLIFHFSINAIPNVHYEIQSPPPRI